MCNKNYFELSVMMLVTDIEKCLSMFLLIVSWIRIQNFIENFLHFLKSLNSLKEKNPLKS